MRILPCGDRAVLVELEDRASRTALAARLRDTVHPEHVIDIAEVVKVVEVVEGALTVLVRVGHPAQLPSVVDLLRSLALRPTVDGAEPTLLSDASGDVLRIPTTYDGPDLASLSNHLGLTTDDLVARHTSVEWVVDFAGFLPGFAYLVPSGTSAEPPWPAVPRRSTPRTSVPTGSVALAGPWCGIYPSGSPGGWQLIGSTDLQLWDQHRAVPALLTPGRRVRFEATR